MLHDAKRATVRFIYFADVVDKIQPDPEEEIPTAGMENSLTLALIRRGRSMMGPSPTLRAENLVARDERLGPDSEDWLGVPMVAGSEVRGAIVVQSYDRSVRYTEEDRALLGYVAQHILTALERKQAHAELERRREERMRDEFRHDVGDPDLVERQLLALVERLAALGLDDLSLSTNGERLAELAAPLRRAGLLRLNVSLDSLDPQRFQRLTRHGQLPRVLAGLEAAQAAGCAMIDAPVSGGTAGAAAGTLTFIVGGETEALERARPLLEKMGKNIFHAGDHGAGQVAKICNNMLLAIHMIGTAEALNLGTSLGLDAKVIASAFLVSPAAMAQVATLWPGGINPLTVTLSASVPPTSWARAIRTSS